MSANEKGIILIVDDDPLNINVMSEILEDSHDILFATNGRDALKIAQDETPDLIILDIMMPEMDGYEVCKKIKADISKQHIPIIFITAKTETEDIVKGFETGGSDYITKPFKAPELLARVKKEVELKILRGLIPICANCKDIRDDKGVWNQIEAYIQEHSDAKFSHGLCPDCSDEIYGNEKWYKKMKKFNE